MQRIPSLDGVRAISIALVVLGHLGNSGHAPLIFKSYYIDLGVEFVFVLSGYLITTILLKEHQRTSTISLRDFYIRRAYRIFPAAFVFMAFAVIAYWPLFHWYNIAAGVLYLANFDATRPWIFGQLWSLGVEEQFYLLWPSVLKRWHKRHIWILVGVLVLSPVVQAVFYHFKVVGGTFGAWPLVATTLATGCLLAMLGPKLPKVGTALAVAMLSTLILIQFYAANTPAKTLLLLFVILPIRHLSIAGLLLHVVQVPYRILNWAPVVWLGRISYSLYLWQQPFCASRILHSAWYTIFAVACAALSFYLIEQPMLRLRETQTSGTRGKRTSLKMVMPLTPAPN